MSDAFRSRWDRYLGMTAAMTQVPVPTATLQGIKADTLTYNDVLRDIFNQTETVSLMHETLLKPELLVNTGGEDCYLVSQFGLMDAILDEKLGFIPKREEGELILMGKK